MLLTYLLLLQHKLFLFTTLLSLIIKFSSGGNENERYKNALFSVLVIAFQNFITLQTLFRTKASLKHRTILMSSKILFASSLIFTHKPHSVFCLFFFISNELLF